MAIQNCCTACKQKQLCYISTCYTLLNVKAEVSRCGPPRGSRLHCPWPYMSCNAAVAHAFEMRRTQGSRPWHQRSESDIRVDIRVSSDRYVDHSKLAHHGLPLAYLACCGHKGPTLPKQQDMQCSAVPGTCLAAEA